MAKKSQVNDLVRTVVSTTSKYMLENVFGRINDELKLILDSVEKGGYRMQRRMLGRLFSFLTLVVAGIFIVLGIHSFLLEYLMLTNYEAYLLVGAVLLVTYYLMSQRQRNGNEKWED